MTINKFIKYTSLLVLGTWMLSAPGNAFAENEAVSKEVNETINRLMTPDDNGTHAEKLKNEELAKIRGNLLSKIKGLQVKYKKNIEGIEGYQKQIEELQKKLEKCKKSWMVLKRRQLSAVPLPLSVLSVWQSAPGVWDWLSAV